MKSQKSWRQYQRQLQKQYAKTYKKGSFVKFSSLVLVVIIFAGYFFMHITDQSAYSKHTEFFSQNLIPQQLISHLPKLQTPSPPSAPEPFQWKKDKVKELLSDFDFYSISKSDFRLITNDDIYSVETSLIVPLQKTIKKRIKPRITRYFALVAIEPSSGRILSMVGFDNKNNNKSYPCTQIHFPAASIFKIVTAAAAIEICGLNSTSELTFNGRKYTLYKKQISEKVNRYTHRISFKDSFAQSINPVFGKLGALYLGRSVLEEYAEGFGFNKQIPFELPVISSEIEISDKPYEQAEIASGFNRDTAISPLHGALLASTIINNGKMPKPSVVDSIKDHKGNILYKTKPETFTQSITPATCAILKKMMNATVRSGTGRKSFRGSQKDRVLSKLNIGGKTGSISNKNHKIRYDWFVGFAEEKNGKEKIAISIVVAHDHYIGLRACQYARLFIKEYFKNIIFQGNYAQR